MAGRAWMWPGRQMCAMQPLELLWPKLRRLMDKCGYDLHSVRRRETETQRENRLLREENAALRRMLVGGRS